MGKKATETDDVDAYDLILKDKERLLSLSEPVRFIFSHSALREGWDNPNVFVICALKHSDNTISRRQEVGRGLRLSVNQQGDRMDHPSIVHDINVLTVVASESYKNFVAALQNDISESVPEQFLCQAFVCSYTCRRSTHYFDFFDWTMNEANSISRKALPLARMGQTCMGRCRCQPDLTSGRRSRVCRGNRGAR